MSVTAAVLVPHPPLIIDGVTAMDTSDLDNTRRAYLKASRFVLDRQPDTIVICTPHNIQFKEYFHVSPGAHAAGDMSQFDVPALRVEADYDEEFVAALCELAREQRLPVTTAGEEPPQLDHATVIPLHYLEEANGGPLNARVVRISPSGLPLTEHYRLGQLIAATADKLGRNVAFMASGDLSHVLQEDGPYGFDAVGPGYDRVLVDVIEHADFGELFSFSDQLRARARECGHSALVMLAGCLDGRQVAVKKLSYHDMLGIGYCVCIFDPGETAPQRDFYAQRMQLIDAALRQRQEQEGEYVRLARAAISAYVNEGRRIELPATASLPLRRKKGGVFVTLYQLDQARGSGGNCYAQCACLGEELIASSLAAADDPLYAALCPADVAQLVISVDVLSEPELVTSPAKLDPQHYGVVVSSGERQAMLPPELEGVNSVGDQLALARAEAGIGSDEPMQVQRFTVERHF